ncbi:MAG: O-antigen ligase family protein [Oligoflexales bacterium]|nr:O-antigen ligase family protein [Oligoflexales bacterium]
MKSHILKHPIIDTHNIDKLKPWENLIFVFTIFTGLMAPAPQYLGGFLIVGWFLFKRQWKSVPFLADISKNQPLSSIFSEIKKFNPALNYIVKGSMFGILFTLAPAIFFLAVKPIDLSITKIISDYYHLITKLFIYAPLTILIYLCAVKRGFKFKNGINIFILLLTINLIYLIVQRYTGIDLVHGIHAKLPVNRLISAEGIYRTSGAMSHPLILGYNCMMFTLVSYSMIFMKNEKNERLKWIYIFAVSFFSLVLTNSRWPTFVTVFLMISFEIRIFWKFKKWILPFLSTVLLLLFFLWNSTTFLNRYKELLIENVSWEERIPRISFWKIHWQMFMDHPLLGVFYPLRKTESLDYYVKAGYTNIEQMYSAHNIYLQTLSDSGILGMLGLLSLIIGYFKAGGYLYRNYGNRSLLMLCLSAILAGFMQNTFRDTEYIFGFWLCVTLILVENITTNQEHDKIRDF